MTDNYFVRRHDLRKKLSALLKEYDELTSGPTSNEPVLIVKVRAYLSQQKAKREIFTVIDGIDGEKTE